MTDHPRRGDDRPDERGARRAAKCGRVRSAQSGSRGHRAACERRL